MTIEFEPNKWFDNEGNNIHFVYVDRNPDCDYNTGGWYCRVYRSLGIGNNPYDYGEMEFEDEYYDDFCIHTDDCDCTDDIAVEEWIENNKNYWAELMFNPPKTEEDLLDSDPELYARIVLKEYYELDLERMPVADALEKLSEVAESMAICLDKYLNGID